MRIIALHLLLAMFFAIAANASRIEWEPIGISGGGALYNPAVSPLDPRALLVDSDMGGRYVSSDGGTNWSIVHYSQATASVQGGPPLFHPTRAGLVFALTGYDANRLSVTHDNGRTWTRWDEKRQPPTGNIVVRMFIDAALPDRLFLGSSAGEILFTDDEGAHWIQGTGVAGAVLNFAVQHSSSRGARVCVVGTTLGVADPRFKQYNVDPDWMTRYLNQSWTGAPLSLEISAANPDIVLFSDPMFFLSTVNGGKHWRVGHTLPASPPDAIDADWKNNGLVQTSTWHHYIDPHESNRHYICYTDIGFARSTDAGKTWHWWGATSPRRAGVGRAMPVPDRWANTCYELAFDPEVPGRLWGAFSEHHDIPNENSIWVGTGPSKLVGGVARSEDFATTWIPLRGALPEAPVLSIVLDPKSPRGNRTLYAAVYDHGVYQSIDDRKTWSNRSEGLGDLSNLRVCRLQLHRDGALFALVTGMRVPAKGPFTSKGVGLYRSKDGAGNWEKINSARPLLYPKDFTVDPDDSRIVYVGAADLPGFQSDREEGGLYRTVDGGNTWERILRKRPTHFGAFFHPHRKGWIYATATGWGGAADGGLWISKDNGANFETISAFPFSQVQRVEFDPHDDDVIYVSTFGASVWRGPAG